MSQFLEVPLVGGGTHALHHSDPPKRARPHPTKPIVTLTFHDGVELTVALPWSRVRDWFDTGLGELMRRAFETGSERERVHRVDPTTDPDWKRRKAHGVPVSEAELPEHLRSLPADPTRGLEPVVPSIDTDPDTDERPAEPAVPTEEPPAPKGRTSRR